MSVHGVRADERDLWVAVVAGETARVAGKRLEIHPRRVEYLCRKWTRNRVYNYGVCHDLGWIEIG